MVQVMKIRGPISLIISLLIFGCMNQMNLNVETTLSHLKAQFPDADLSLMERGVKQTAALWYASDGTQTDFTTFCIENFAHDALSRKILFDKLSYAQEVFNGGFHKMNVSLTKPVQLEGPPLTPIDELLASYAPSAHFYDDMFANKLAFITILNFPNFSLQEKNELGADWSRLEWAYARMGDIFTNRLPASVAQEEAKANSAAENYIAEYNIVMGNLLDEQNQKLFPADMVLLSHWNLRDELKSNYAAVPNAFAKQNMIYRVMTRIVEQTIPKEVINNPVYDWAPYPNKLYKEEREVNATPEGDRRYAFLLDQFKASLLADPHYPAHNTAILRAFDGGMEISFDEIEEMFTQFISSQQVSEVANLIKKRLGRDLAPFDIWYDGFKARSGLSEEMLTLQTTKRYPTAMAYEADISNMLVKLGYAPERAKFLSSKIVVEAARGSGHAWGAESRDDVARLRTRLTPKGMDYKGFNIAVHEMGHNVEQTISLYNMDHYMLQGVPNTAFTETLAFIFQKRDLEILGFAENNPMKQPLTTLDIFWGSYEIMGVALVDMKTWKWLYDHPKATASELKIAVLDIAKTIWNQYYAPILGTPDSPILAIYSHIINTPLYLANYPFGHIIEFQLEEFLRTHNLALEIDRWYAQGRLVPQ
ncbi:MAG: hypothetical protein LBC84_06705, partial [Prevotellaceae bacterium]|nr:hypothetical protein [Prevotellaceae bacterium]